MVKRLVIIIIILCSLLLYNFKFLGSYAKLLELLGIGLMFATSIFHTVYDNSFRFRHNFSLFILIILLSLPFSMYIASLFHHQSIGISLYAQRSIYYYFLYFVLHQLKIRPRDFEKIFFILAFAYVSLYLLQYILYPRILFDARIIKERGTIRILLSGMPYLVIGYFYALQKSFEIPKLKYILLLMASLIIIILIGSRSLLFTVIITTMLNMILNKRIKSRLVIYTMGILGIILIFYTFQNIFQELINTALYKDPISSENIRFRAARYFISRFFPNTLAYIFGNGASGARSEYSHTLWMASSRYFYYLGDIGIVGVYVKYGIIFILGVFGILYKVLTSKIQSKYNYIKYFYIFTAIAMIVGGGFDDSDFIVLICITLYIIDVSKFNLNKDENPDKVINDENNQVQIQDEDKTQYTEN